MMLCFAVTSVFTIPQMTMTVCNETGALLPGELSEDEWSIDLFDGKLSHLENVIFIMSGFFGFLRLIDLLIAMEKRDREMAFAFFMERVDKDYHN